MTARLSATTSRHDTWPDALEAYFDNGWTDGLPVVPPTPDAVEAMLASAGLDGTERLGSIPTRDVTVSAEKVAINAVMAGCRPEYFPVVVAAVAAVLQPLGNAHSTTATLAGAAHAVIVNGPARTELDIVSGQACFGPGFRANATIGRALRLVVRNVFRTVPGALDRASFSWPLRYSFCFGENEESSDWAPLHVLRGYRPDESVVTVQSVMRMHMAAEYQPGIAEIIDTIAATARFDGLPRDDFVGDERSVVVVVGPEHQRRLLDAGWTKQRFRTALFERMTAPGTGRRDNALTLAAPENVLVVAAGGPGMAISWVLTPHLAAPVSHRVVRA